MKRRKNARFLHVLIYLFLALFSIRKLLSAPGVVGHNWDWLIPQGADYLRNMFFQAFSTWQSSNLGEPRILQLPSLPFMAALTGLSFLGFGGGFISKFLIVMTIVLAGLGMNLLASSITEEIIKGDKPKKGAGFASFCAGLFYGFSPFLFADLIGGASTQFFAYAIIPWYFFFVRKVCRNRFPSFYLIGAVIALSLVTISLQALFLSSLLIFVYIIFRKDAARWLVKYIAICLIYLIVNAYWALPTIIEYYGIQKTVLSGSFYSIDNIKYAVPSLWEIFAAEGYWRPLFLFSIDPRFQAPWFGITYIVVAFIFAVNFIKGKSREVVFWLLTLLISFIFATGGKEPMGDQVLMLYMKLPFMALFRSPQHLLSIPMVAFAVLIGTAIHSFPILRHKWPARILVILGLFIWVHPFFVHGDIGMRHLAKNNQYHIDLVQMPATYQKVFDVISKESESDTFSIYFLPASASPYYLKTSYQNEAQGGDPLVIYSPNGALVSDINYNPNNLALSKMLERNIYEREDSRVVDEILNNIGVKYVLLRKDVVPNFNEIKEIWSVDAVQKYLTSNNKLKLVYDSADVLVYQNLSYEAGAKISARNDILISGNNPAVLADIHGLLPGENPKDKVFINSREGENPDISEYAGGYIYRPTHVQQLSEYAIEDETNFVFDTAGEKNFDLWVKSDNYENEIFPDPLRPITFELNGETESRSLLGNINGWGYFGKLNLSASKDSFKLLIGNKKDLIADEIGRIDISRHFGASVSTDGYKDNSSFRIESVDGQTGVLSIPINNVRPDASYIITIRWKTTEGDFAKAIVNQDTDKIFKGKTVPKYNIALGRTDYYQNSEIKVKTNRSTKSAVLYLTTEPASNNGKTVAYFDDISLNRRFTSPVVLTSFPMSLSKRRLPNVSYEKISNTKYLVSVKNATDPYFLVFKETFNREWQPGVEVKGHYLANFYANAWLIDKKGDYDFAISYYPQKLFIIGSIISVAAFIITIIYVVVARAKHKRTRR